ncbi:YtxH domain-containing protein [Nostocoides sp. HKS02]|uniref:YtxH domain-containing protein n=1 Tax=Nostocoides sp. HKS02 TaxID=1813880 RepID=UPI0012B480AA|nr:YtxH domain-containing protein [Tetrasphaera sp. HKS02]QGN58536.1 YtxH domain-containing protein [Tetrasphaera sp. HKS02]
MSKLSFLAGLGVGYVLGAKAGQKRYAQIRNHAERVWSSDPVQARVDTVKQTVKDQAPAVAAKLGDAAKSAGASAKERLTGEDLPPSLHRGTDHRLHADTTGYGPGGDKLP